MYNDDSFDKTLNDAYGWIFDSVEREDRLNHEMNHLRTSNAFTERERTAMHNFVDEYSSK